MPDRVEKGDTRGCTCRHGGHVGGQEQKHFSPLGTKLYFHVNYSRKYSFVLTPNMAALSRGCKPRVFPAWADDCTENLSGALETNNELEIRKLQDLAKDFGGTASKAEKKICQSKIVSYI